MLSFRRAENFFPYLYIFLAYSCKSHEFRCRNNLCVERKHLCDGIRHCPDGTDELEENCKDSIMGKQHIGIHYSHIHTHHETHDLLFLLSSHVIHVYI